MHLALHDEKISAGLVRFLSMVGNACIKAEGIDFPMQVGLMLTDDTRIAEMNHIHRGLNDPTDVLSFPSVSYPNGTAKDHTARLRKEWDADVGCVHLGDIALSVERARAQAVQYGHSLLREIGFLFAHGVLHLMGYDHLIESECAVMRVMEEDIMKKAGIVRELSTEDQ